MEEIEKLKKKEKLCVMLGAKKFQKVVLAVENGKWKLIKKVCPNYIKHIEKYVDFKKERNLKKAKTEEEKNEIIDTAIARKMAVRKEFFNSENINYHLNPHQPSEFIKQLEWNKDIHKRGMIVDAIALPIFTGFAVNGNTAGTVLAGFTALSLLINFECVNIQNYNICRFKRIEKHLKKKESKEIQSKIEKYQDTFENMTKTISEKKDIPTEDEIINNIKTPEQAENMKKFLLEMQRERQNNKSQKTVGGKKII